MSFFYEMAKGKDEIFLRDVDFGLIRKFDPSAAALTNPPAPLRASNLCALFSDSAIARFVFDFKKPSPNV